MIRNGGKAASHHAQEGIGGEMLASFRGNDRHGHPHRENLRAFQCEVHFCIKVYEKTSEISWWLRGFIGLRELLIVLPVSKVWSSGSLCLSEAIRKLCLAKKEIY